MQVVFAASSYHNELVRRELVSDKLCSVPLVDSVFAFTREKLEEWPWHIILIEFTFILLEACEIEVFLDFCLRTFVREQRVNLRVAISIKVKLSSILVDPRDRL